MTTLPIEFEPLPPVNSDWIADWAEDEAGVFRYHSEPERDGVKVIGWQRFDGSERPGAVYLRGDRELTAAGARALALALSEAADGLDAQAMA